MQTNTPKVTIITIYYNRVNAIQNSVKSLIDQTYKNLEIIIVDDFSTDDTYEELKKMSSKDSRIKIFRNERNYGFTKTLINIINSVDCRYIAIHGAGDISIKTRITEQVKYLEDHPEVGVLSTGLINAKRNTSLKKKNSEITIKDLLKRNSIVHGSVMFRLTDYKKVRGYRAFFTYSQDKDLWYRMSMITRIHCLTLELYEIIEQKDSVTNKVLMDPIPLLLSDFATFLMKERLRFGYDSLDIYNESGALMFNPSKCNKYFYHIIRISIIKGDIRTVKRNIDTLMKTNLNIFHLFFLKIVQRCVVLLLRFKK